VTKRRALTILFFVLVASTMFSLPALAAIATPTPSASATTSPEVRAGNEIVGLIILTAFAAGGYFVAKWIRRDRRPRPPGPWFGGMRER